MPDKDVVEARKIMRKKKRPQGRPAHDEDQKAKTYPRASMKLTPKKKRLVEEYFKADGNMSKAARQTGYTDMTADKYAYKLFADEVVQAEIQRRKQHLMRKYEVSADRVIEEMAFIAFNNFGDLLEVQDDGSALIDMNNLTPQMRAAMSEYTVETYMEGRGDDAIQVKKYRVKFHDKKAALDSLSRTLGLFNDKVTVGFEDEMIEALQAGRRRAAALPGDNAKVIEGDHT